MRAAPPPVRKGDTLFVICVGFIWAIMIFLYFEAIIISGVGMITDDNLFNRDYALFTTKAWIPQYYWWQPAKLNFAQKDQVLYTKEILEGWQQDHLNYMRRYNEQQKQAERQRI